MRGRLGHPVEFGAKFFVMLINGIACALMPCVKAFHEVGELIGQCQAYWAGYGTYPAKVFTEGVIWFMLARPVQELV